MKQIAQHHADALVSAPATIKTALQTRLAGPKANFEGKYGEWRGLLAQRAGAVIAVEQLLTKLSAEDIEDLETAFKAVFKRGTPQHTIAFAGGREPYQSGSDDERLDALQQLERRIADLGESTLDAVGDLVAAVRVPLETAMALVSGKGAASELARTEIEPLRATLAVALYKNLAQLMSELGPSEQVAAFFDLLLLRETGADEEPVVPEPPVPPVTP